MSLTIKLRSRLSGGYIFENVFFGPTGGTLEGAGALAYGVDEFRQWRLFNMTLRAGARQMHGQIKVICEGDTEVLAEITRRGDVMKGAGQ